jgi:hypothetical protein
MRAQMQRSSRARERKTSERTTQAGGPQENGRRYATRCAGVATGESDNSSLTATTDGAATGVVSAIGVWAN